MEVEVEVEAGDLLELELLDKVALQIYHRID